MEDYFERVVETLTGAGYRWYETANFCRAGRRGRRDLRAQHNLAYWLGRDYLGLGIGAVSTIDGRRWRNTPRLGALPRGARRGRAARRASSSRSTPRRAHASGCMLGLRLDEPLPLAGLDGRRSTATALARLERLGLAERAATASETLALTRARPASSAAA